MSIPKSLELPEGVRKVWADGRAGEIATLSIQARGTRRGGVLLIPGWTGSKEDFTPLLPLLADAGYDATAYDQRGQYESEPGDSYTLDAYADDALRMVDQAGPFIHLLGHSFGGLVAQRAAVRSPELLLSLSLLCTGPGALGDSPTRPLKRLVGAIGKVPLLQIHEVREQGIKRPAQITRFLAKRFTSNDPASLKAMTQLLLDAPDIIDEVAATHLPFWVGRGADDDAWPHDVQARMAERLGTEIHIISGAAHSPGVEDPDGLMTEWLPFLHQHSPEVH